MRHRHENLTSDPAAEHHAARAVSDDEARAADARAGGDATRAPRSLLGVELTPDDEAIASNDDWDDPERL
jgi:hypothetical protein